MRKFLADPALLEQFKADRPNFTARKLAQKYGIAASTVGRIFKDLDANPESEGNEEKSEASEEKSVREADEEKSVCEAEGEETKGEESVSTVSFKASQRHATQRPAIDEPDEIVEDAPTQKSLNASFDHSLHNFLDENSAGVRKREPAPEPQTPRKVPSKIKTPLKIRPSRCDVDESRISYKSGVSPRRPMQMPDASDEDGHQVDNLIVKIRKMMQFFAGEVCIQFIIGSTESAQRRFSNGLHAMSLAEITQVHKKIQFELLFSRSNTFVQDSIEQVARFGEKAASAIGFDVVGVYDEMQADPEFQFYMQLLICDMSYIPSAKQIIFMKFVKNYYVRYQAKGNVFLNLFTKKPSTVSIPTAFPPAFPPAGSIPNGIPPPPADVFKHFFK